MRILNAVIVVIASLLSASPAIAVESVGTVSAPALTAVEATASCTYDKVNKVYKYRYTVSNGAASTGNLDAINIDMINKYSSGGWYNGYGLSNDYTAELLIPIGGNGGDKYTFAQIKKELTPLLLPPGRFLIPFGITVPNAWDGAMSRDGYASFESRTHESEVRPGRRITGLVLTSPGVPVIREMIVVPFWVPVFPGEPDKSMAAKAGKVERAIRVHLHTLGPEGTAALSWSALESEVSQAVNLGWIRDMPLVGKIRQALRSAARIDHDQHDNDRVIRRLRSMLTLLRASPPSSMRPEARALIRLNAEALIRTIRNRPDGWFWPHWLGKGAGQR